MAHLDIEPNEAGVPYAVFDFGGGTTDFDFGSAALGQRRGRSPGLRTNPEHLASGGDSYLGGENLLEHLVYASFQHNLEVLRTARIQFTKPLDATPFNGSEAFLANTQAAQTNTVMLAARLRPFLERDKSDTAKLGQIKLDLIDADGAKQPCELTFDEAALDELLANKIRGGVLAFLGQLVRLRPKLPATAPVHVLLAGNGAARAMSRRCSTPKVRSGPNY